MIFGDKENTHNHGISSGIIPRFYLQMLELASFALNSEDEKNKLFETFDRNNIPDFIEFYDVFHQLKFDYNLYKDGLINGKFLKIEPENNFSIDRTIEIEMRKSIKNFFVIGRRLLNNFVQSDLVRDEKIDLRKLVIVNDDKFIQERNKYILINRGISYEILFKIIEDARSEFLETFNNHRGKIEHSFFEIPKFEIKSNLEGITIIEPTFNRKVKLIDEIEFYYNQILNFIENLMVYYFGLKAYQRTNGNLTLYCRKEYNFSMMNYNYVIQIRIKDPDLILLIN